MKIAIPLEKKDLNTDICMSFGRTPFFAFIDTDTLEVTYLDNTANSATGGAGIKAAQAIVDQKADALITERLGQNASDVLDAANIKIYKSTMKPIMENITAFKENKLEILTNIHPGFHNHGGQ
ncbi:MAG: NifB/NifX family molybdenum-iron cluster-binding protein [Anaerovoracaceae bacterium]